MTNNLAQLKISEQYLGEGGSRFRRYCGLPAGAPYCVAYVVTCFAEAGNASLFCNGRKEINCIPVINWCYSSLAVIPLYLALPEDVILFDWNSNDLPDHIGFAMQHMTATQIMTIEGNTRQLNSKGQTVRSGVVATRIRTAGEIQAVFRPHFPAIFTTTKLLELDGNYGYNSIAMTQLALKGLGHYAGPVDGILGKGTVMALQKWSGVKQDGAWGTATSKAIQRKIGVEADGFFGPASVKALQQWVNNNVKPQETPKPAPVPKPVSKVTVDGDMGTATVKASQKLFGTPQDGIITGQLKANEKYYPQILSVSFGGGGSLMVKRLQAWLGVGSDGIIGPETVKAWQKKIGVKVDGYFGTESVKAWQKFLNEHDSVVVPVPQWTIFDDANAWARKIAADSRYNYVDFSDASWTQGCPICHPRNHGLGWNCIGFSWAIWRHGAGIPCRCNCEVINDSTADRILRSNHETAVQIVKAKTGLTQVTVISNGGKAIPLSSLRKGDIVLLYDGKTYYHTMYYMGNSKFADSTQTRSDNIKADVTMSKGQQADIKIAIRFTGKVVL